MRTLAIFLIIYSSLAMASPESECGPVRLDQKGGSMEHVPPLNQGQRGTCYAATATQLFDAYRHRMNPKDRSTTSSEYAALLYASDRARSNVDGGLTNETLQLLFEKGACDEEYFKKRRDLKEIEDILHASHTLKLKLESSKILKNLIIDRPRQYNGLDNYSSSNHRISSQPNANISIAQHTYETAPECLQDQVLPLGMNYQQILDLKDALFNQNHSELMSRIAKYSCPEKNLKKVSIKTPKIHTVEDEDMNIYHALKNKYDAKKVPIIFKQHKKQQNKRFTHKYLVKGMPVAIEYCSAKVLSKSFQDQNDNCGAHASLIIGRKFDRKKNACMLLVRNSWGTISGALNKIKPVYNKDVAEIDNIGDGANFWIKEDYLYSDYYIPYAIE